MTLQQSANPVRAVGLVSVAESCVCARVILSPPSNLFLRFSSVRVFRTVKQEFSKPLGLVVFCGMWSTHMFRACEECVAASKSRVAQL